MATTYAATKWALFQALDDAMEPGETFYSWGPDVQRECVFLGRAIVNDDRDRGEIELIYASAEVDVPQLEQYTIPVSIWSFRNDVTPQQAHDVDERADAMYNAVIGAVSTFTRPPGVKVRRSSRVETEFAAFESGWASIKVVLVEVTATIT